MEAASRMAFELEMWRTDALQIGAIKTTEHWVEAAFEAGYKAAMTVAAEPHSEDVAVERERCATICDKASKLFAMYGDETTPAAEWCARQIRKNQSN
jgi:hypothetical protein